MNAATFDYWLLAFATVLGALIAGTTGALVGAALVLGITLVAWVVQVWRATA